VSPSKERLGVSLVLFITARTEESGSQRSASFSDLCGVGSNAKGCGCHNRDLSNSIGDILHTAHYKNVLQKCTQNHRCSFGSWMYFCQAEQCGKQETLAAVSACEPGRTLRPWKIRQIDRRPIFQARTCHHVALAHSPIGLVVGEIESIGQARDVGIRRRRRVFAEGVAQHRRWPSGGRRRPRSTRLPSSRHHALVLSISDCAMAANALAWLR